jgi:hypothetical protein
MLSNSHQIPGIYLLNLSGALNGCPNTFSLQIKVTDNGPPEIVFLNGFSPNNDGINHVLICVTLKSS